ncbi:EXLDI protein [Micromonospora sp. CA-248089]|uniref:EXLDI protein n=1 Tax=Micromonospora sp. CA-248089 TaxID=3239960 RepID=UPI003D8E7819
MPNKTIYVSDEDLPLFRRAQELVGGNLSAAITAALRRFVEVEEGRLDGFDEIVVRVGQGLGRRQRFSGVLLGEWGRSTAQGAEHYRVYRSRSGKFVVHIARSEQNTAVGADADKWNTGWRSWIGNWSADQTWTTTPAESLLHVADTLEDLRELLPAELYDLVVDTARHPVIEDLQI